MYTVEKPRIISLAVERRSETQLNEEDYSGQCC